MGITFHADGRVTGSSASNFGASDKNPPDPPEKVAPPPKFNVPITLLYDYPSAIKFHIAI